MRMRSHWFRAMLLASVLVMSLAGAASAHVTVWPKQVQPGAFEKFVVRVPSEKEIPTVAIKVEIPAGFRVSRAQPVPGWQYEFEQDASGNVVAVSWSGGEIGATEFMEFALSGRAAADPGKAAWRAWQTYQDGSVVEWTGPSDAEHPASVMEVVAPAAEPALAAAPAPAAEPAPAAAPAPAPAPAAASPVGGLATAAAYGGLVLGALALVAALRKR